MTQGCELMWVFHIYHSYLLMRRYYYLKKFNDHIRNSQIRHYGEMIILVLQKDNNCVMLNSSYLQRKGEYTAMKTMCSFASNKHAPPYWKCALRGFSKRPRLVIPSLEYSIANYNIRSNSTCLYLHIGTALHGACVSRPFK